MHLLLLRIASNCRPCSPSRCSQLAPRNSLSLSTLFPKRPDRTSTLAGQGTQLEQESFAHAVAAPETAAQEFGDSALVVRNPKTPVYKGLGLRDLGCRVWG